MKTGLKWQRSYDNFLKAIKRLEAFLIEPIQSDRDEAGIVQAFEFTYELAWKTIQKYAEDQGIQAASPKQSLSAAAQMGLIDFSDENAWLKMIDDRNLTVHTYDAALCHQIYERIRDSHFALIKSLADGLAKHRGR